VDYFETGIVQLREKLAPSIAANVSRVLVNRAPQSGMLRHGNDQATAGAQGRVHLEKRSTVLLDVFEHVKCTDGVELRFERQLSRIHFEQLHVRHSPRSYIQASPIELYPHETHVWKSIAHTGEDEPRSATHLEHAPRVWEVPSQRPDDQTIPRSEPEAPLLGQRKIFEKALVETARRGRTSHGLIPIAWPIPVSP